MFRQRLRASLSLTLAVLVAGCGGPSNDDSASIEGRDAVAATPPMGLVPLDTLVTTKLLPRLDAIFNNLVANGMNTRLDGVAVFDQADGDPFLPGKVAIGMSYLLLDTPRTDPRFSTYVSGYRRLADMTVDLRNESWGIYYYCSALWKLKTAGLLDPADPASNAVSPATLARLRTRLDWRVFVDSRTYALINLPTNYYGVAFSTARLRYLLGWEGPEASVALLQKTLEHYRTFSAFGFADETDGAGRFDRYSVLLIGEIAQRVIETDMVLTEADRAALKGWLRQSVDLIVLRLNPAGNGFDYGRSLAAYADTAFVEVLSAAAHLNVLTPKEKEIAYAFSTRVAAKYVDFWYDADMQSVNMWEKGRRVDAYRGKARILGENLSLTHQILYTSRVWKNDGFGGQAPLSTPELMDALEMLPRATLTRFAGFDGQPGTYDRGLVTYRDGARVISLPMINGAGTYHRTNPYFAVPFSYNLLSGAADSEWAQLQPRLTMGDGRVLIPAAYIKNVTLRESGSTLTVSYTMDGLDRAGGGSPARDTRFTSSTTYTFQPGQITRVDVYTPAGAQSLERVELEFGSYSGGVTSSGRQFTYASGDVTGFEVEGLDACTAVDVGSSVDYRTPTGPLKTSVRCTSGPRTLTGPLTIQWVLKYRTGAVASFAPR